MAKTKAAASPAVPKARATTKKSAAPTREDIALRAYHIYLERKGAPGDPHADWVRAERELLEAAAKPAKAAARKTAAKKITPIDSKDRSAA